MRRRQFLRVAGVGAAAVALGADAPGASRSGEEPARDDIYTRLVTANDARLPALLQRQAADHGTWPGVVVDEFGVPSPGGTAGLIGAVVAALASPGSRFASSPDLVRSLASAAGALRAMQHADGTIDLPSTNFHSPPDTAFALEPVCDAIAVLRRTRLPVPGATIAALERFARAAGESLVVGGVHTANHRWVVCAALARLHSLFPDGRYVTRVDEWLVEGIDIDADGQFSERSTSIYSPVCDRALMTVARLLKRPALLDPVRRNLEMTLFYLHASGDLATESSRRQDQYRRGSPASYHLPYRWMAITDRNGRFAQAARMIESKEGPALAGNLLAFHEDPALRDPLPASEALPDDFVRVFAASDLARIRRGPVSGTVLAGNPCVLAFQKGAAVLEAVRLASAFFGKGQFVSERLEVQDGAYVLTQVLTGPYYQPLSAADRHADGAVHPGDRERRRQSEVQRLVSRITVRETSGRFDLDVDVAGTDRVPLAIELGFRKGGTLGGVTPVASIADAYLLRTGTGTYTSGGDTIRFGPGNSSHTWTSLRGALPKLDAMSVYLTGFTPFRERLQIE